MNERIHFGRHWIGKAADDLLFFKFVGPLDEADSHESRRIAASLIEADRPFYVICDLSELGTMTPAARRMAQEWYSGSRIAGSVTFGSRWTTRAIAEMVLGTLRVMGKLSFPVTFVPNEAEALAWVAEQRLKLKARSSGSGRF